MMIPIAVKVFKRALSRTRAVISVEFLNVCDLCDSIIQGAAYNGPAEADVWKRISKSWFCFLNLAEEQ